MHSGPYLHNAIPLKALRSMPGVEIVKQSVRIDHLHTVMIIPPKYAVSAVIGQLKA